MTKLDRRQTIRQKLLSRTSIVHTGFMLNGELSACYLWTGPTSGSGRGGGYGRCCIDGETAATHIVSWVNENGYIPKKKQLDHLCNNRLCIRNEHLELVTHLKNQRRRAQRAKDNMK